MLGAETMGHEWKIKSKNREINEVLPFIKKYLVDEGIDNFSVCSNKITIPSSNCVGWDDMQFILDDNHLYFMHLNFFEGQNIVNQIENILTDNDFDLIVEEL